MNTLGVSIGGNNISATFGHYKAKTGEGVTSSAQLNSDDYKIMGIRVSDSQNAQIEYPTFKNGIRVRCVRDVD